MLHAAIRLPLRLIPNGTVMPVLSGPLRGARWIVGAHTHGCWIGHYERGVVRALMPHLRPGAVFYDLGANAGYFSLIAARRGCRVVAVEPLPRNVEYLRRHAALNGAAITVVEAAVAEAEGIAYLAGDRATARLANHGLRVTTTTLRALAGRYGTPDVVKCDIEGGEARAMADVPGRPVILLATHGAEGEVAGRHLLAQGYALTEVDAGHVIAHPHP